MGNVALAIMQRPSDLVELEGSPLERLLFDAAVIAEASENSGVPSGPETTRDKIMRRRRQSGLYT